LKRKSLIYTYCYYFDYGISNIEEEGIVVTKQKCILQHSRRNGNHKFHGFTKFRVSSKEESIILGKTIVWQSATDLIIYVLFTKLENVMMVGEIDCCMALEGDKAYECCEALFKFEDIKIFVVHACIYC
jgi:hypothetical protein